jgi:hypothetical protein
MAKEIDAKAYKALVTEVKKDLKQGENKVVRSERELSEASGVPMNQIGKGIYLAELDADPSLAIKGRDDKSLAKAIATAKDGEDKMRWPRIAVRAGISVGKVQALYEMATGKSAAEAEYSGRGRKLNGNGSAPRTRGTKSAKTASATSRGTSGRRASRSSDKAASAPKRGNARTRGTRASAKAAANPR